MKKNLKANCEGRVSKRVERVTCRTEPAQWPVSSIDSIHALIRFINYHDAKHECKVAAWKRSQI